MKRKKVVKKAEEVKQESKQNAEAEANGGSKSEVTPEQERPKQYRRSPWDNLVFMKRRPQPQVQADATVGPKVEKQGTATEAAATTEENPVVKPKRQGWSWI